MIGEATSAQAPKAEALPAEAKPSTEIPEDLSIPQFLRREKNSQPLSVGATKPNRSRPQKDEPAQDDRFASPQQCMQPTANEVHGSPATLADAANTRQPIPPVLERPVAPQQHKQPVAVELRVAGSEQYLDRSVDIERLLLPLVVFPKLTRVIPQSDTAHPGWSAFIDAIAPTPAPVVVEKKDVP